MRSPRLAAVTSAVLIALAGAGLATPATADTTPVPGTLASGVGATVTLDVPVPAGLTPVRIDALLRIEAPDLGDLDEVRVAAGTRVLATLPAEPGPVSFAVRPSDVTGAGVIPLEMTLLARDGATGNARCGDFPQGLATLEEITLETEGEEAAPGTIADFLPATVRQVDVVVDPAASEDLLGAALSTVTAVSSQYPAEVKVALVADGRPAAPRAPGRRVIRLAEDSGDVTSLIDDGSGVPTLTLTGTPEGLSSAAAALASPNLGLADGAETTGLGAAPAPVTQVDSISFTDLGAPFAHLAGYGRIEQYVRIRQDSFGGPVDGLHVSVRGTHSAVARGVDARFDTYVNGSLLDSFALDQGHTLNVEVDVPTSILQADNSLVFVLDSTPPNGGCNAVNPPPVEVHLDSATSSVSAVHGDGPGGFVAYPQAFSGNVPVVLGGGAANDRFAAARDGAQVLAALQREAARPLTVSVTTLDEVLRSGPPAALVLYPDEEEAGVLGLPLALGTTRTFGTDGFTVDVGSRYAVLETGRTEAGARVLTLGSWQGASDLAPSAASARLVRSVARAGWPALAGGDVYVVGTDGAPASYNSGAVGYPAPDLAVPGEAAPSPSSTPASEDDDDSTTRTRQLVGAGIGVLFVIGFLIMVSKVARNRRRDAA